MPGCVLRATGDNFQVEKFLESSPLIPCNVFCKGERKSKNNVWKTSGITFVVSDSSGTELAPQIRSAIEFLRDNSAELSRLRAFDGVRDMVLDFGVTGKDIFLRSYLFPAELIAIACDQQMGIELSIYGEEVTNI